MKLISILLISLLIGCEGRMHHESQPIQNESQLFPLPIETKHIHQIGKYYHGLMIRTKDATYYTYYFKLNTSCI